MKLRKFLTLAFVLAMLFSLVSCDLGNLDDYKITTKTIIQTYADDRQDNYNADNWMIVCSIVENGKKAVDEAKDRDSVDAAVENAKEAIDKVIKLMYGAEDYIEGNGTEHDPYIISNRGQLIHFSNQINNGEDTSAHFALGTDIDLEGMEWTPIGIFYSIGFSGILDGRGYEISNFCINSTGIDNVGLFGYIYGSILNLGVTDFEISVTGYHLRVGGLVGYLDRGSIKNCYTIGNIEGIATMRKISVVSPTSVDAGGLVGLSTEGTITNCYAACTVIARKEEDISTIYVSSLVVGDNIANCLSPAT